MTSDGASVINPVRMYWWLLVFPGAAMALNLLGDRLRDILDARMRQR